MDNTLSKLLNLDSPKYFFSELWFLLTVSSFYIISTSIITPKKGVSLQTKNKIMSIYNFLVVLFATFLAVTFIKEIYYFKNLSWCDLGLPKSSIFLLEIYHLFRYLQILETYLQIFLGITKKITLFHQMHHLTMLFTSWLWLRANFLLIAILVWLNAIDNLLYYSNHIFQSKSIKNWLIFWTESETAIGYCFGAIYLLKQAQIYFKTNSLCENFPPFLTTVIIHAGIGFFLSLQRQGKVFTEKIRKIWYFSVLTFGLIWFGSLFLWQTEAPLFYLTILPVFVGYVASKILNRHKID